MKSLCNCGAEANPNTETSRELGEDEAVIVYRTLIGATANMMGKQ